jgi:hypothetical protein
MSNSLRLFIIVALIVVGVVAFSICGEAPFDACSDACCGLSNCLRPTGRIVRGLGVLISLAASTALGALALVSLGPTESLDRFALRSSALAAASSLRI